MISDRPEIDALEQYRDQLREILVGMVQTATAHELPYFLAYGTALGAYRDKDMIPWDLDIDIYVFHHDYDDFIATLSAYLPHSLTVRSAEHDSAYEQLFARVVPRGMDHNLMHMDIFPLVGVPSFRPYQLVYQRLFLTVVKTFKYKRVSPVGRYSHSRAKRLTSLMLKALLWPISERLVLQIYYHLANRHSARTAQCLCNPCGSYGAKEILQRDIIGTPTLGYIRHLRVPLPEKTAIYLAQMYGDYVTPPSDDQQERALSLFDEIIRPRFEAHRSRQQ